MRRESLTDAGECVRSAIWWSNEKNMREVNGITLIRASVSLPHFGIIGMCAQKWKFSYPMQANRIRKTVIQYK